MEVAVYWLGVPIATNTPNRAPIKMEMSIVLRPPPYRLGNSHEVNFVFGFNRRYGRIRCKIRIGYHIIVVYVDDEN